MRRAGLVEVRATEREQLSEADVDLFIARTQFHLANGTQHIGFCSPALDSPLDVTQPVIVTPDGLVFFHFDKPPSQETIDEQWRLLGVGHEQVFPVHFRCTVPIDGTHVTGIIEADDLTGPA